VELDEIEGEIASLPGSKSRKKKTARQTKKASKKRGKK
jgi:hypothetical protein